MCCMEQYLYSILVKVRRNLCGKEGVEVMDANIMNGLWPCEWMVVQDDHPYY